jgi:hypothetical protein
MNKPVALRSEVHREPMDNCWTIGVLFDKYQGQTRARAELRWLGRTATGVGFSRLGGCDPRVVDIDHQLAAARALADLANRVMAAGARDMDSVTGAP